MIKIKINNKIVLIDIFDIEFDDWLKISNYIIEKYGFKFWLEHSYYVRHKDELEEKISNDAIEWLMNH